jgi:hypothetical protein
VIISSGSGTLEDLRLVERLGAFAFLPKAYKCEELVKVVMDALRSARGITTLVVTLLAMAVMSGSLSAADTNRLAVPGRDDMSRYIGAKAKPGEPIDIGRLHLRIAIAAEVGVHVIRHNEQHVRFLGGSAGNAWQEHHRHAAHQGKQRPVADPHASLISPSALAGARAFRTILHIPGSSFISSRA